MGAAGAQAHPSSTFGGHDTLLAACMAVGDGADEARLQPRLGGCSASAAQPPTNTPSGGTLW